MSVASGLGNLTNSDRAMKRFEMLGRQRFCPLSEMSSESVTLPSPLPLTKHAEDTIVTVFTIVKRLKLSKPSKLQKGKNKQTVKDAVILFPE